MEPVTILFHQPPDAGVNAETIKQLPCAGTRAADDRLGICLLKQHFVRLTQCLPLELHAGGLTVFTQDFCVTRKLTDDAATIEQEYVVQVAGDLAPDGLKLLNHGLSYNGKSLLPVKAIAFCAQGRETRLGRPYVQSSRATGGFDHKLAAHRACIDVQIARGAMALFDAV